MLKRRIYSYIFWFILFSSIPNILFVLALNGKNPPSRFHVSGADILEKKLKFFKTHRDKFNLVFVGDSKTHQGIDPQFVDRALGNSYAYNIAAGGNWTDTQYVQLQDLLPVLPPGTWVVWTIGDTNFVRVRGQPINLMYPIHWRQVPDYMRFGFTWDELWYNVFWHNIFLPYADFIPGLYVYARRLEYYQALSKSFAIPQANPILSGTLNLTNEEIGLFEKVRLFLKKDPEVLVVEPIMLEDKLRGALVHKGRGNVITVELEPGYFRDREQKEGATLKTDVSEFRPAPEYWKLFLGILDLFQKYKTRLVVNELEQAPHMFRNPGQYDAMRRFMEKVRQTVEARGIPYIRVDFSRLGDECYRDYNHFNSQGVVRYNQLLANEIQKIRK